MTAPHIPNRVTTTLRRFQLCKVDKCIQNAVTGYLVAITDQHTPPYTVSVSTYNKYLGTWHKYPLEFGNSGLPRHRRENKYSIRSHSPPLKFFCCSKSQTFKHILTSTTHRTPRTTLLPTATQDFEMCLLYMLNALRKNKDGVSEEPNTRPARSSHNRGESPSSRMPGDRVSKSQGRNGGSGAGYEGRN